MIRYLSLFVFMSVAFVPQGLHARSQALFYMTTNPNSVRSFLAHANKVDVIVPTWYSVDGNGLVWGDPDDLVMRTARQAHVPVMPIIVNASFNQQEFHKLAITQSSYENMIGALLRECDRNGYMGFQFDFENVAWTDRDALTALVTHTATALHSRGYKLTIATVPNAPGYPGATAFDKWIYANWRGAYDLKALAAQVDLICLMTYDEHTRYTPPGPVSGWSWMMANLDYALQFVPKEKLSLGIPLYGLHWYAGDPGAEGRPSETSRGISGPDWQLLIETYHPKVQWDDADKTSWFYFYRDQIREWVFFTDERAFKARWDLVNLRGLAGFCSWVLGDEDPAIWEVLPQHQ
jgi:spore germination protein YaaH